MGRDKALVAVDGVPLLRRVASRLLAIRDVDDLVVACGPPERAATYAPALRNLRLAPRFAADRAPGLGPVAGLAAGLLAARSRYVAVAPVDAAGFLPAVAERLLARAAGRDGAVVLRAGRPEVLWGVFARHVSGHFLAALSHGVRSAQEAAEGLDLAGVDAAEFSDIDPGGAHFRNVNAPHDI